jgi:hypothetical protein
VNAQAIAERMDTAPANVEQHPASTDMLGMIERMAVNPNIDPEKLERLIAMKKDIDATNAKVAFTQAMVRMRPELPRIAKLGKTDKATYGKWEDIQDAIDPVLNRHGFDLTFKTDSTPESVTITAVLRHEAGNEDTTSLTLPADKGPGRNGVQAIGSTSSYGKRYTAAAILNLRIGGEDDDAKRGGGADNSITEAQVKELRGLIDQSGTDIERFCVAMKIDAIPSMAAKNFEAAKNMLLTKIIRKQQGTAK